MQRQHRNKADYGAKFFYREFRSIHPEVVMTEKLYTSIVKTFFELAVKRIVEEAYRLQIPSMGLFYLVKKKQKIFKDKTGKVRLTASVNWPATKEQIAKTGNKSARIYYINDHTDRYVYKITWDKYMVDFTNKTYYTFAINKKHRQYLNNAILTSDKPLNAYEEWYQ